MSTGDAVVPLVIFVLGATAADISGLVKFVEYMARSYRPPAGAIIGKE